MYARKYKFRIFLGILCGMLTTGTFLPLFQVIQPTLEKVSENEARIVAAQEKNNTVLSRIAPKTGKYYNSVR